MISAPFGSHLNLHLNQLGALPKSSVCFRVCSIWHDLFGVLKIIFVVIFQSLSVRCDFPFGDEGGGLVIVSSKKYVYLQEKMAILDSHQRKAKITTSMLNSLEGVTCCEVTGSLYAFPRIKLPRKAIEAEKVRA